MYHFKVVIIKHTKQGSDVSTTEIANNTNGAGAKRIIFNILNTAITASQFVSILDIMQIWSKNICGAALGVRMEKISVQGLDNHP